MCYDDNARPPLPADAAGEATGEDVVLTAADGNQFAAYIARPAGDARARMLIYPDIRGLHQFYKELALRFAEQGVAAVAMDYFGRTAGLTARDESFEFWPHVQQLKGATVLADTVAALQYLNNEVNTAGGTFVVGFCLGGSLVLHASTQELFTAINDRRAQSGCPMLEFSESLARAAHDHSQDMAQHNFFSHTGSDGSKPADRAKRDGYSYLGGFETITAGQPDADGALSAWMGSKTHRDILLNCRLNDVGLGFVEDTDGNGYVFYWTAALGSR